MFGSHVANITKVNRTNRYAGLVCELDKLYYISYNETYQLKLVSLKKQLIFGKVVSQLTCECSYFNGIRFLAVTILANVDKMLHGTSWDYHISTVHEKLKTYFLILIFGLVLVEKMGVTAAWAPSDRGPIKLGLLGDLLKVNTQLLSQIRVFRIFSPPPFICVSMEHQYCISIIVGYCCFEVSKVINVKWSEITK